MQNISLTCKENLLFSKNVVSVIFDATSPAVFADSSISH